MDNNETTQHIIVNGRFSNNGNLIGIDSNGERIHIYKKDTDIHNLKSIQDIKFPLFAIGTIKVFDELSGRPGDEDRKPILTKDGKNKTFERLTAMALFTSFESLINAYKSIISLNQASIDYIQSIAKNAGLEHLSLDLDIDSELKEIEENRMLIQNITNQYNQYKSKIKY